jgi:hypothetical protein
MLMSTMNPANLSSGGAVPSVINPSLMNGNNNTNNAASTEKKTSKNNKVTLDKNGKPKRKKASRGMSPVFGSRESAANLLSSLSELSKSAFNVR